MCYGACLVHHQGKFRRGASEVAGSFCREKSYSCLSRRILYELLTGVELDKHLLINGAVFGVKGEDRFGLLLQRHAIETSGEIGELVRAYLQAGDRLRSGRLDHGYRRCTSAQKDG